MATPLLLVARMGRIPQLGGALALLLAGSLLLPGMAPLMLRSLEMNPWQALWGTTGAFLATSLREQHGVMEAALPRPPRDRRGLTVAMALPLVAAAVSASAALTGNSLVAGLTTVAFTSGLALALASVSGAWVASMGCFVFALLNWIFGLSDDGVHVRVWAVLVHPANSWLAGLSILVVSISASEWIRRGSGQEDT